MLLFSILKISIFNIKIANFNKMTEKKTQGTIYKETHPDPRYTHTHTPGGALSQKHTHTLLHSLEGGLGVLAQEHVPK